MRNVRGDGNPEHHKKGWGSDRDAKEVLRCAYGGHVHKTGAMGPQATP